MAVLALLPISVGAVVTTVEAGMAFADWPSSDGQNMIFYPWFRATGDKFLEHGHRLAGMLIGIVSLVFTTWSFFVDRRPVIRRFAVAVLLGVIAQGVLGGLRVRMNQDEMAFLHGNFAAWVFTVMCLTVVVTAREKTVITDEIRPRFGLVIGATTAFLAVLVQYLLGGRLRHFGSSDAWLVHPWFAVAVIVSVALVQVLAGRQELPRIQSSAQIALWLVAAQAALGIFTWGAKYGYPQWDILAERLSPVQVSLSSLHKVVGLLTFAAIGVAFVQIVTARRCAAPESSALPESLLASAAGGPS
jgi:cytochrome c oxidase assembly protein subunit 15